MAAKGRSIAMKKKSRPRTLYDRARSGEFGPVVIERYFTRTQSRLKRRKGRARGFK